MAGRLRMADFFVERFLKNNCDSTRLGVGAIVSMIMGKSCMYKKTRS